MECKKGQQKIGLNMIEILWHGRGGQGAFTAAKLLGAAYSLKDKYSLAFPSFGPERRGAPVLAFTKLSSRPIGDRSQIKKADYIIFLDDTLFSPAALNELKAGGKIFINTKKKINELGLKNGDIEINHLITFDADSLALEVLKMPVTNTVMLALLVKESGLLSSEDLLEGMEKLLPEKILGKNLLLVEKVFGGDL